MPRQETSKGWVEGARGSLDLVSGRVPAGVRGAMGTALVVAMTFAPLMPAARGADPARREAESVEVEGFAAVVNNDIGRARDKAVDDAKRKAVEQVAGTHVSSQSITQNFQLIEDRVYARASGFVKKYTIESQFNDQGTYRVKIRATVDAGAIVDSLDQILKVKPRVIVMIAEQNIGGRGYSYWWSNAGFSSEMDVMMTSLIAEWQPRGFKFIDPGLLRGKLKLGRAVKNHDLDDKDAMTLSKEADADIAIVGKVWVTDAGPVMEGVQMHSFHATGTLRVLNVDTGEIVAVADDGGVAPHIDANAGGRAAIKTLASKIAPVLEKRILEKWTQEAAGANDLELVADGAASTQVIDELARVVEAEIRGVERITLRRREKGKAFFTVRVRDDALSFGRELETRTYKGFALEISSVTKAKIEALLKPSK